MTAEKKKGKYVYYRCTGFKGACGNEYIREERLSELLGEVVKPIQITAEVGEDIATALRAVDGDAEQRRCESLRRLDQRRRVVVSKLDRGYDDLVSGRISEEFWTRGNRRNGKPSSKLWTLSGPDSISHDRLRLPQPRGF
jgi:site-specific DNA recombinase